TPDNPGWYQGTADAVRQSLRHISNMDFEYILILSGDQLYQMDFSEMLESHKAKGADISIATIPVDERDAPEFGILKADDEDFITSFIEKPKKELLPDWVSYTGADMQKAGRNYLASMGIYIFSKHALYHLLNNVHPNATDFGKEIIPDSIENYKVISFQYDGYWTDIGNIYSFYEANLALTQEIPPFNLFDNNKTVYSRARMLPPAKISGTTLEKTIIAEGSIIHAIRIEQSVVEEMSSNTAKGLPKIGIGERCYIKDAIIDKNCRIGNDVRINGGAHLPNTDHALYTVKDGIVVVKKLAVLPDGFVI
ncbi:MAG: hypothetical protein RJA42_185, partial [Bacteroidota bacterium]